MSAKKLTWICLDTYHMIIPSLWFLVLIFMSKHVFMFSPWGNMWRAVPSSMIRETRRNEKGSLDFPPCGQFRKGPDALSVNIVRRRWPQRLGRAAFILGCVMIPSINAVICILIYIPPPVWRPRKSRSDQESGEQMCGPTTPNPSKSCGPTGGWLFDKAGR